MIENGLRPRQIVTRQALENPTVIVGSTRGSTNAGLAENLKGTWCSRRIRTSTSGVARTLTDRGRRRSEGKLAPEGAIVNFAGIEQLQFEGWRSVSDCEERCVPRRAGLTKPATSSPSALKGRKAEPTCARCCRHRRGLRATHGRSGRLDHRGTLFRRDAWFSASAMPGRGAPERVDRAAAEWRPRLDHPCSRARSTWLCLKRSSRFGVPRGGRVRRIAGAERLGSSRNRSEQRGLALSRTGAALRNAIATRSSDQFDKAVPHCFLEPRR